MLRLSFSTGILYHLPLQTSFALAREAGFDGVELVHGPEVILRGVAYVRRLSREYELPVLSVHPPIVPYPGMYNARRTLSRLVALAEAVECDLVVLHTPKTASMQDARWTGFVDAVLGHRSNPRVRVSLENSGIFYPSDAHYVLHDIRRLGAFAERYDLPVTFDTAHAGTSHYPLLEAFACLNGRVVNVHFSDLVRRPIFPNWRPLYTFFLHHQMPGEGILPLSEFVSMLLDIGYSGALTLEISPTAIRAWNLALVRASLAQAVQFVRRLQR